MVHKYATSRIKPHDCTPSSSIALPRYWRGFPLLLHLHKNCPLNCGGVAGSRGRAPGSGQGAETKTEASTEPCKPPGKGPCHCAKVTYPNGHDCHTLPIHLSIHKAIHKAIHRTDNSRDHSLRSDQNPAGKRSPSSKTTRGKPWLKPADHLKSHQCPGG